MVLDQVRLKFIYSAIEASLKHEILDVEIKGIPSSRLGNNNNADQAGGCAGRSVSLLFHFAYDMFNNK